MPRVETDAPERTQLGAAQREWLFGEFEKSKSRWRILGNPSVLSTTWRENISEDLKLALLKTKLIAADGNGPDYDQWDGYPAERRLVLNLFRKHLGSNVVLSGDIHVGMVCELEENPFDGKKDVVAVEFINSSISSQNLDDKMGWPDEVAWLRAGYYARIPAREMVRLRQPRFQYCGRDPRSNSGGVLGG